VGFFFPVVPQAQARIRTQVSAAHTEEDLRVARAAFIEIAQKYDLLGKTKAELLNLQL
jgi:glycine C-acetyltransferase